MAYVQQDLLDRIAALERDVRQLRGRSQMRPAMNTITHGEVSIGEGGSFSVDPPGSDSAVFAVGAWSGDEFGVALRRQTGQIALSTINGDGSAESLQPLRLYDAYGHELWSDDIENWGMSRPYISVPMAAGKDFSSTSWTTTHIGRWFVQHPRLWAEFSVYAGSGSVEAALFINSASGFQQLGNSATSSNGTEGFASLELRPPDHGQEFGNAPSVFLRARRNSGSGSGTVWCRGIWGLQS